MIELIMVIVIGAALAVVTMPKMGLFEGVDVAGAGHWMEAVLSAGQKRAIATRRVVWIEINPSQVRACWDAGCSTPLVDLSGASLVAVAPSGATFGASVNRFAFDATGNSSEAGMVNVQLGSRVVHVEAGTGLIWGEP